ncbi:hypothetical protein PPGU16_79830 (plasmid) [Paraburkholderia largidicola]|uniref:Uncharacterized protein n=1 Tax=Paraburkholderia largidicola TaxID=3014751 RepID=A0A7I8C1F4_9BURK|nr:hypothetical protein PPGU16_79830 [Paraburkholderia sp. PGU16]
MVPFYRGSAAGLGSRESFPVVQCRGKTFLARSADREYSGLPSRTFSPNVPVSA